MRTIKTYIAAAIVFVSVMKALNAHAQFQNQTIELSADETPHYCDLYNEAPGVRTVYVRLEFNIGTAAARFRVVPSTGLTLSYLSETHPFATTLGNTQTGISVCFGQCVLGDAILATINYMSFGTGPSCGKLILAPHPGAETVEVLECDGLPQSAWVIDLNVPRSTPCGCPPPHVLPGTAKAFNCEPVAVQASTWGTIKALYRD